MNKKTVDGTSFVYGPQTNAKVGPYGAVIAIAFFILLATIYTPKILTIG